MLGVGDAVVVVAACGVVGFVRRLVAVGTGALALAEGAIVALTAGETVDADAAGSALGVAGGAALAVTVVVTTGLSRVASGLASLVDVRG